MFQTILLAAVLVQDLERPVPPDLAAAIDAAVERAFARREYRPAAATYPSAQQGPLPQDAAPRSWELVQPGPFRRAMGQWGYSLYLWGQPRYQARYFAPSAWPSPHGP